MAAAHLDIRRDPAAVTWSSSLVPAAGVGATPDARGESTAAAWATHWRCRPMACSACTWSPVSLHPMPRNNIELLFSSSANLFTYPFHGHARPSPPHK